MSRLVIATFASETVMGAQVYERAVSSNAQAALDRRAPGWEVSSVVLRSLRSPLPGTRRAPMGWLGEASVRSRSVAGRLLYPRADIVHRTKVGLPPAPGRDVVTLHDIGPWKYADEGRPPSAAGEELSRARAIVTPSAFSAGEIVDMFGVDDPVVIPNGFDRARFIDVEPLTGAELAAMGIGERFVLTAGGASQRKNLTGLAAAWPQVRKARPDMQLVLSGPDHENRTRLFAGMDGVKLAGRLSDDVLPRLMAAAGAVVIPSLYEGFGLPALEGMAVGVPVVALRASSLPEVVGDAGVLTEPDADHLAEGIIWATSGDSAIDELVRLGRERAATYSWERSADLHAALWAGLG